MADKYDIGSNNTLDRREMQCPRCFEYRLEPNYEIIDEFTGQRDKVIYATKCGNDVCPVDRVDPDDIRKQTPNQNVIQRFATDYGVVATVIVLALIALVAGLGLTLAGVIGPGAPVDLDVTVYEKTHTTQLEGAEVVLDGKSFHTDAEGTVSLGELGPDVTKQVHVYPDPTGDVAAPPPTELEIGDGKVWSENPHPDIEAEIRDDTLHIVLPEPYAFDRRGTAPDETIEIPFANAHNAQRGVEATLHGVSRAAPTQVVPIDGTSDTVTLLDEPDPQRVTVSAPVTEREMSEQNTYSSTVPLSLEGQRQTDARVRITDPGGQYPAVSINSERVCTSTDMARNDGVCTVPNSYLDGDAVALSFDQTGVEYTFEYTAQSVADDVTVTVNGEEYRVESPAGVSAGEAWERTIDTESFVMGDNTVKYDTPIVESVETTADVSVEYELTEGLPESPTVYVESADGTVNKTAVPEHALERGVLMGSHTLSLEPEWFAAGTNRVWVETENGGRLFFDVSAELGMEPEEMD